MEKVITIKKRGGGTRKQRVKVLASGKFKFIKNKVRSAGSKIKSKTRRRSSSKNTNKQGSRSKGSRKMASKQSTLSRLYPKKKASDIAIKAGIGVAGGIIIRLATMFNRSPLVRETGTRAAASVSAYLGGGTGELAYQATDAVVSRAIIAQRQNGNGGVGLSSTSLIIGGA